MNSLKRKAVNRLKKKKRIRSKISGTSSRPRVSVFKSLKYLYLQAIDDSKNVTICACSSLKGKDADGQGSMKNIDVAYKLGQELGIKLKGLGIETVLFDRNSYRYHGKIKSLADGIRESGLVF